MPQRRKFSAEFKREAVDLTRRPQASVSQVAQELGVNANVLSRWRREQTSSGKALTGAGVPRDEELVALRRELMELGDWPSYEMVLRYAHLAADHLRGAACRIDGTFTAHTPRLQVVK